MENVVWNIITLCCSQIYTSNVAQAHIYLLIVTQQRKTENLFFLKMLRILHHWCTSLVNFIKNYAQNVTLPFFMRQVTYNIYLHELRFSTPERESKTTVTKTSDFDHKTRFTRMLLFYWSGWRNEMYRVENSCCPWRRYPCTWPEHVETTIIAPRA